MPSYAATSSTVPSGFNCIGSGNRIPALRRDFAFVRNLRRSTQGAQRNAEHPDTSAPQPSVMEFVAELYEQFPWGVPVESAEGYAVVDLIAAVGYVQCVCRR